MSAIIGTGAGAFNSLPANLPIFGRVDQPLAVETGGGFPQDDYRLIEKVDFSLGQNMQASIRYAYRNQETYPGTQSASPYPLYNTGTTDKDHNINGSLTRVWSSALHQPVETRLESCRERAAGQRRSPAAAGDEPRPARASAGLPDRVPRLPSVQPGSDIPAGGPQKLFQVYQDQTWLKGNHDIRFGGSYVRINDDHTFSAYSNAVEALNTSSNALVSLNNFVLGQILRFQAAINPEGFPGGTFVTPVPSPSFTSFNRTTSTRSTPRTTGTSARGSS